MKRFKEEKLYIGPYIMVFDQITDEPLILGCVNDGGKWKIFETTERGGHYIIEEFKTEEEAFDRLMRANNSDKDLHTILNSSVVISNAKRKASIDSDHFRLLGKTSIR